MSAWATLAHAQTAPAGPSETPVFHDQAQVIAATPLPGVELALDEVAAPVQVSLSGALAAGGALDLSESPQASGAPRLFSLSTRVSF